MFTRTEDSYGPASAQPSILTGIRWSVPLLDVPQPAFPGIPEPVAAQEKETGRHDHGSKQGNLCFWHSALDEADLSLAAIGALTFLIRCSAKAFGAFPSFATIAKARSISRRTAIRAVKELEKKGLIEVAHDFLKSNRYRVRSLEEWQSWQNQIKTGRCSGVTTPGALVSPPSVTRAPLKRSKERNPKERERERTRAQEWLAPKEQKKALKRQGARNNKVPCHKNPRLPMALPRPYQDRRAPSR
jgi:Helix-turn-helix domain